MKERMWALVVVGAGLGVDHISYREKLTAPFKSTERGYLPSVHLWLKGLMDDGMGVEAALSYSGARLYYDGSTTDGVPSTHIDRHHFVSVEGLYTQDIYGGLGIYGGVQFRSWLRGVNGFDELYKMLLLPLGLRFTLPVASNFKLGLDASFRFFPYGSMMLYAPKVNVQYPYDSVNLPLGASWGWRVSMPLRLSDDDLTWVLTPWYQHLRIQRGEIVPLTYGGAPRLDNNGDALGAHEPASDTHEWGAMLGLEW